MLHTLNANKACIYIYICVCVCTFIGMASLYSTFSYIGKRSKVRYNVKSLNKNDTHVRTQTSFKT